MRFANLSGVGWIPSKGLRKLDAFKVSVVIRSAITARHEAVKATAVVDIGTGDGRSEQRRRRLARQYRHYRCNERGVGCAESRAHHGCQCKSRDSTSNVYRVVATT